jgi:hypothetical protein
MMAWPDSELMELWGNTLLQMARFSKGPQAFFELFQNGCPRKCPPADSVYEPFAQWYRQTCGKEGIETFNSLLKDFYLHAGVVPRIQYNELQDRFTALKKKVVELEQKIEQLKPQLPPGSAPSVELMAAWTQTAQKYSKLHQSFFEEFSKLYGLKK